MGTRLARPLGALSPFLLALSLLPCLSNAALPNAGYDAPGLELQGVFWAPVTTDHRWTVGAFGGVAGLWHVSPELEVALGLHGGTLLGQGDSSSATLAAIRGDIRWMPFGDDGIRPLWGVATSAWRLSPSDAVSTPVWGFEGLVTMGLRVPIGESTRMTLTAGAGLVPDLERYHPRGPQYRFTLGISKYWLIDDQDHDGVGDRVDKCPDTPPGALVHPDGCPFDSDGDGVYDGLDRCPETPFHALVDRFGCPMDSDGDGVPDGMDLCPNTPHGISVNANGCPSDRDGDGVPDYLDVCANTPAGAKVDSTGCPLDTDDDGVPDGLDQCPGTPRGVTVDATGCPTLPRLGKTTLIGFFDEDGKPFSKSWVKLDSIAARLSIYPTDRYDCIIYTDGEGSAVYNLNRARRVGEAVRTYMLAKGIDGERLHIIPAGKVSPAYDNHSPEGRLANRRVVIRPAEK